MKNFSVAIFFAFAFSFVASGGGIGGGPPPMLDTPMDTMMMLRTGALEGGLIRYTEFGKDPVYLRPDLGSIKANSFSATALPSGTTTTFYVENEAVSLQSKIAVNSMRTMKALMPGMLPVLPEDLNQKPKPQLVIVMMDELNEETMAKISGSPTESGDEIPVPEENGEPAAD